MARAKRTTSSRYGKFGNAAKNNPVLNGADTLMFDGFDEDEIKALTPEQHADIFFSEWMREVDPLNKYPRYFMDKKTDKDLARYLGLIKQLFLNYCAQGDWSEEKFVMVIDHMLESNMVVFSESLEKQGERYDKLDLPFQRMEKRMKKGRI